MISFDLFGGLLVLKEKFRCSLSRSISEQRPPIEILVSRGKDEWTGNAQFQDNNNLTTFKISRDAA